MKKSEPPHMLEVSANTTERSLSGRCSCVAGAGGYCHHVIGLYHLALLKQLGHRALPDDLTCTIYSFIYDLFYFKFYEREFILQIRGGYNQDCYKQIEQNPNIWKTYGICRKSVLCYSQYFHVVHGLPGHAMHDVL